MSGARHWEQDKEATVYIGNLDERVGDHLVWELMLQAGRIVNVHLPKDRVSQTHQGYGFVEFISEEDAEYAARVMNQVRLYGKPIRVNKASADKQKIAEVGAELFVGNLDAMVDEKTLHETFSRFGSLLAAPKIARDDAGLSKGFAFISFSNFEASDEAIANMNGQYLMNKEVAVQYAFKKDGKGERHGDEAERMLAAQAKKHNVQPQVQPLPPQLFQNATAPIASLPATPMLDAPPDLGRPMGGMPPGGGYMNGGPALGRPHAMNGGFASPGLAPPSLHGGPPPRGMGSLPQPLPAPPAGLPNRPPPSMGGYGGPQAYQGPGVYGGVPPPPVGFAQPLGGLPIGIPGGLPPGFVPPPGQMMGMPPPGFGPPTLPGHMPPGFQGQHSYMGGR